jgi:chromosome segregation ATPase
MNMKKKLFASITVSTFAIGAFAPIMTHAEDVTFNMDKAQARLTSIASQMKDETARIAMINKDAENLDREIKTFTEALDTYNFNLNFSARELEKNETSLSFFEGQVFSRQENRVAVNHEVRHIVAGDVENADNSLFTYTENKSIHMTGAEIKAEHAALKQAVDGMKPAVAENQKKVDDTKKQIESDKESLLGDNKTVSIMNEDIAKLQSERADLTKQINAEKARIADMKAKGDKVNRDKADQYDRDNKKHHPVKPATKPAKKPVKPVKPVTPKKK